MPAKTLEQVVMMVDDAEEATQDAREASEKDRDYYDGKQWTEDEAAELAKRGQPQSVFNRVAPKIDFILGMEAQTRTDPKAFPRTPMEDGGAEAVTDVVRYIMDANGWDNERSDCGEDFFIEGTCAVTVHAEPHRVKKEMRVVINRIPWDRLFWDPRSRFPDFRDATYYGTVMWMDLDDVLSNPKWAHASEVIEQSVNDAGNSIDDTYDDRPKFGVWSDHQGKRHRVKIVQMWYKAGFEWYVCTFTEAGFLEKPQVSPYLDEDLESVPGLIIQSCKVDRNNDRYGLVRPLISPQEEINKRRSKSLHLLNMRQVIADTSAVQDRDLARRELAKPDGWVEVRPETRFEIAPTGDMTTGHFQLLAEAKAEIDAIGANSALTGKDPREHSGRAIQARQQGGAIELARLFDRFRSFQLRVYRAAWMRARQYWSDEKTLRVTDSEKHIKYVGINQPVTKYEMLQHRGQQLPPLESMPEEDQIELTQVVGTRNNLAEADVDIIMDEGPDAITLQAEQFDQLTSLLGSLGGALPPPSIMLMLRLIVEASGLRSKKQIVEMLETGGVSPEEQQKAQAEQEQAKQIQMANIQLDLEAKRADIQKTMSSAFKDVAQGKASLQDATTAAASAALKQLGFDRS